MKCFLSAKFSGLTLYRVRELGIRGRTPNAGKRTPFPTPRRRRPDLVRHDFNSPVPTYKLVGDITYLRTREGRLYLSTVIDPNTHMVVGRSLSARFDGRHRGIGAGVGKIARLRGRQRHIPRRPRRPARQQAFVRVGARQRRAADLQPHRTGSCHDNAVAESFFAPLKNEMYYRRSFPTRDSAKHAVIEFIEAYCNRRRPHSTIGYKVPAEAMEELFERTAPKPEELPMAA